MPRLLITAIALLLILTACGQESYRTERFYSMGTFVSVTLPEKQFGLALPLRAEVQRLENLIKDTTETANKTQDFNLTGIMGELQRSGNEFSELTGGRFSIYAYTIAKLYGFHEGPYRVPSREELEEAMDRVDTLRNVMMDMGAYAKGYIVDKAVDKLKLDGVRNAMVNAGGDLYALGMKGKRKWHVAIKHPDHTDKYLSVVNLNDVALATSGDYERFFTAPDGRNIFHIFDAETGENPQFYHSVSVIAKTTEQADGLATAFFLLPKEDVENICTALKTPVLLYTREKRTVKLCGWEKFENN